MKNSLSLINYLTFIFRYFENEPWIDLNKICPLDQKKKKKENWQSKCVNKFLLKIASIDKIINKPDIEVPKVFTTQQKW